MSTAWIVFLVGNLFISRTRAKINSLKSHCYCWQQQQMKPNNKLNVNIIPSKRSSVSRHKYIFLPFILSILIDITMRTCDCVGWATCRLWSKDHRCHRRWANKAWNCVGNVKMQKQIRSPTLSNFWSSFLLCNAGHCEHCISLHWTRHGIAFGL